jgi:hypothetical protein
VVIACLLLLYTRSVVTSTAPYDAHLSHSSLTSAAVPPALYCHTLCKLLSQRSMVASATLSRYRDTLCLARRAVAHALHTCAATAAATGGTSSGVDAVWESEPHAALQLPLTVSTGSSDDGSAANTVQCAVPVTLLRAAVALLALHSSDTTIASTTTATTTAVAHVDPDVQRLLNVCFPGRTDSGGLHSAGLASAQALLHTTNTSISSAVIDAGSWVLLGQSRSAVCSELAAQHMPPALLPRLLLAAGLCSACVHSAVARLNAVSGGDAIAAGAAYKEVR